MTQLISQNPAHIMLMGSCCNTLTGFKTSSSFTEPICNLLSRLFHQILLSQPVSKTLNLNVISRNGSVLINILTRRLRIVPAIFCEKQ